MLLIVGRVVDLWEAVPERDATERKRFCLLVRVMDWFLDIGLLLLVCAGQGAMVLKSSKHVDIVLTGSSSAAAQVVSRI